MLEIARKINCILLIAAFFLAICGFAPKTAKENEFPYGAGVFSWDHLPDDQDVRCMLENNITEIYQYIKPEYTEESIEDFLKKMADYDIDVYILDGEPEWCYTANYDYMEKVLDKAIYWNEKSKINRMIRGIVFDVEPYVLDKWNKVPDELLDGYTSNLKRIAEENVKRNGHIKICTCIPYSYDIMGKNKYLREFIRISDAVLVLNYYKGHEIENIKREAALARWYKKRLVNVYELQPGLLSQTNNSITYYRDGLDAANNNYRELLETYKDREIGVAYHTLNYLKVLSFDKKINKDS